MAVPETSRYSQNLNKYPGVDLACAGVCTGLVIGGITAWEAAGMTAATMSIVGLGYEALNRMYQRRFEQEELGSSLNMNKEAEEPEPNARPEIDEDKQGKHIEGHKNYGPGRSTVDHPDLQGLVDKHAGSGVQVGPTERGMPGFKERVDFGEEIGTFKSKETKEEPRTTKGIIHYDKKGKVHVVPARP